MRSRINKTISWTENSMIDRWKSIVRWLSSQQTINQDTTKCNTTAKTPMSSPPKMITTAKLITMTAGSRSPPRANLKTEIGNSTTHLPIRKLNGTMKRKISRTAILLKRSLKNMSSGKSKRTQRKEPLCIRKKSSLSQRASNLVSNANQRPRMTPRGAIKMNNMSTFTRR